MEALRLTVRLTAWQDPGNRSAVDWLLWIYQDGQGNGVDELFAGRVKLQDDSVASAHAVLENAVQKLQTHLGLPIMDPLF